MGLHVTDEERSVRAEVGNIMLAKVKRGGGLAA